MFTPIGGWILVKWTTSMTMINWVSEVVECLEIQHSKSYKERTIFEIYYSPTNRVDWGNCETQVRKGMVAFNRKKSALLPISRFKHVSKNQSKQTLKYWK